LAFVPSRDLPTAQGELVIGSISRRYARALLEVAVPNGTADEVADELEHLSEALSVSEDLRNVLFNPAFDHKQRHLVVNELGRALGLGPTVHSLARLLVDRDRFKQLDGIADSYRELADEHAGRARASVRTAAPLPPEVSTRLELALSKAISRKVSIEVGVDPSLLGGAVAQVGSLLFDGSVKTELEDLRRTLKGV
jgi:F-type H+-transporting ATPase subunit delta